MHGVLHAFCAYGDADVVEAAEEGLPQLPVFDGERRVFLTSGGTVASQWFHNFQGKMQKYLELTVDCIPYPSEKLATV
jgi:hypothetical protein